MAVTCGAAMEEIFDSLWRRGTDAPDEPAILDDGGTLRWNDLPTQVEGLALGLFRLGMRLGRRVGVFLDRTHHLPITFLAILRGRGVVVPLETSFGPSALRRIIRTAKPEIVVYDARHRELLRSIIDETHLRAAVVVGARPQGDEVAWEDLARTEARGARFPDALLDAPCYQHWLLQPGGTLSAAEATYRNLIIAAHSARRQYGLHPDDRHMCLLPPGMRLFDHALRPLLAGGSLAMTTSINARIVAERIQHHRVTILQAPSYFHRLLCDWVEAAGTDLSALRILHSCGHTSTWVRKRARRILKQDLDVTWSSMETLGPALGSRRDAAGFVRELLPWAGFLAQITLPNGQPVLEGGAGELWLRGGGIAPRRRTPEAAAVPTLDEDGWLRTGIMARHTFAGEIELLGNAGETLSRQGQDVHLRETERCLEQHPAVMEAAVVTLDWTGDRDLLIGLVQPVAGKDFSSETMIAHCSRRLHPAQVPDRVFLVVRLPHLPLGCIDRAAIHQRLLDSNLRGV